jgi:mercuric reductase
MVEQETIGGTCVNVGCIPSKALLVRSEQARLAGAPMLAEALTAKRELVERLRQTKYLDLLDEYGIAYRPGHARLTGPQALEVDGEPLTGRRSSSRPGRGQRCRRSKDSRRPAF